MRAFDSAWEILKAIDYDLLGELLATRSNLDGIDPVFAAKVLQETMENPINMPTITDQANPRVYRSMRADEQSIRPGQRMPQRFFATTRVPAQQYAHKWGREGDAIGTFEVPVPLTDDSVLSVNNNKRTTDNLGTDKVVWGKEPQPTPQLERIAEANDMSIGDAARVASYWNDAYTTTPGAHKGSEKQNAFNEAMRNAGYDYLLLNEIASQELRPPMWMNVARKVDGGGWSQPLSDLSREISSRFGRHHGRTGSTDYPYRSLWHIGDEASAPMFVERDFDAGDRDLLNLLFSGYADDLYGSLSRISDRG